MEYSINIMNYRDTIRKCRLFTGISEEELPEALQFLDADIRRYEKDELLLRLGESFLRSGVVLEGTVEGSFLSENYNKINLNHFSAGRSFGEALACVKTSHSPIQLRALTDCTVLFLNLSLLFQADALLEIYQQRLSTNLVKALASQNVFSNLKLRIANQRTLRDRILMYLYSLAPDPDGFVHVPFNNTALAEFLGVNRSALSRELGKMQDDGLLLVEKRKMKMIQH